MQSSLVITDFYISLWQHCIKMPGTLLQGVKGSFNPLENVDKSNADRKSKHLKVLI